MWELFLPKVTPYNLRKSNLLTIPQIKSSTYGINSLLFRGILWNTIPDYIKSLSIFKLKINKKALPLTLFVPGGGGGGGAIPPGW